ncbi:cell division protein SepF [Streptococcus caprae]|uniref:Cell division protein SepF n=1 Tax=Streptococcus caprae TaxID=1640501 RepID=A0ABV8CUR7_9STRE
MALKDKFTNFISYFDTDVVEEESVVEAEEIEETVAPVQEAPAQRPVKPQVSQERAQKTVQPPVRPYPTSTNVPRIPPSQREKQARQRMEEQQHLRSVSDPNQNAGETIETPQARIALKYPRKYEDAETIVDLLIVNECVLIDFQYMLDAQARRCLDFIDGASKVLFGNLQKVGSSMYLLTPKNVVVDIEELSIPTHTPDLSYDYDMKRR